ncbi:APC family permease [Amnibacterium kyonggiense]|uniref:Amino acid/polyamine/organocation transporter (APC superfamily) n=1 Tax=Amnibacterium kyonggiense TaxID=595671 RepID=A0A4R7FFD9_9MICO|nr:APC family permease [Amnibacterium kyonggiense]TDS76089.1 amino acid/polyamine/organocation transporter (APC superfamily) [Amnibacterium kyonggiense]
MSTTKSAPTGESLHRELKVTDAASFSIGLIGPVGVMALLGVGAAGILGRGATWAFVFALVAVSLVAYGFVKLSRHIAHTGSVYATVGITLGSRAGFVAGWMLFLAYFTIGAGSTIEIGLFLEQLLQDLGVAFAPDWLIVALVALVVVLVVSRSQVHVITRVLLLAELIGAALVTVLNLIVLFRLGTGTAPGGRGLSLAFLQLPSGTDITTIGAAAVFGFLAFAGFEGAATLGEETSDPKRDIPRALKIAVAVVGAFYLLSIVAQTLGYGTSDADVKRLTNAAAPYGDLGRAYVGPWLADLLTLFAIVSLFAISIGTLSGASRVLFALGRGAGLRRGIARVSLKGVPVAALLVSGGAAALCMVIERLTGAGVLDATYWVLTIGTIGLLVAYVLATVGAIRFLFFGGRTRTPKWQIVVPVLAVLLLAYTLFKNAVGLDAPYSWFPYLVAVWLLVGVALSFRRGLKEQVAADLSGSDSTAVVP